jgi:hypothetical protein
VVCQGIEKRALELVLRAAVDAGHVGRKRLAIDAPTARQTVLASSTLFAAELVHMLAEVVVVRVQFVATVALCQDDVFRGVLVEINLDDTHGSSHSHLLATARTTVAGCPDMQLLTGQTRPATCGLDLCVRLRSMLVGMCLLTSLAAVLVCTEAASEWNRTVEARSGHNSGLLLHQERLALLCLHALVLFHAGAIAVVVLRVDLVEERDLASRTNLWLFCFEKCLPMSQHAVMSAIAVMLVDRVLKSLSTVVASARELRHGDNEVQTERTRESN